MVRVTQQLSAPSFALLCPGVCNAIFSQIPLQWGWAYDTILPVKSKQIAEGLGEKLCFLDIDAAAASFSRFSQRCLSSAAVATVGPRGRLRDGSACELRPGLPTLET